MSGLFHNVKQSMVRKGGQEECSKSALLIQTEMLMKMYYIGVMQQQYVPLGNVFMEPK